MTEEERATRDLAIRVEERIIDVRRELERQDRESCEARATLHRDLFQEETGILPKLHRRIFDLENDRNFWRRLFLGVVSLFGAAGGGLALYLNLQKAGVLKP